VDIDDSPEEAAFRAEARAWLEANAIPKGDPDDFSAGVWSADYDEDAYVHRCRQWQRRLYDGGWAGVTWPSQYGGRGGRPIEQVIFNQEQGRFGVSTGAFMVAIGMVGPTLLAHGSEAQKTRFLPAMLRGDELWCQLFSEPDAGSDLAGLTTRATLDGDSWVVTGQKVWTSAASRAAWGILLARSDWDVPRHAGISYFLVDMASAGIEMSPLRQMTGESHFYEVFLDEVRIPAGNLVGAAGEGWRVAQTTLRSERGAIAGGGYADPRALAELARWSGRASDPLVRQAVVSAHIQFELLRFLRYRTQTALSQGKPPGQEASIMKLAFARYMKHLTETAISILGPTGQLDNGNGHGPPAASMWIRRFLHSPSLRIAGGSDQVQANIVAERALGLPAEARADAGLSFRQATAARN
jgi:alkylation response protein AidB-like acyl-CoA dehydrogenase